jgi:serine O-acetyltransferase
MRETVISSTVPDWSREARKSFSWDPGKSLLASLRDYQRADEKGGVLAPLRKKIAVLRHRFWSMASGADIPINSRIGGGLMIPHPNGIVIHPQACIGPNCLLFQQVTIGAGKRGVPTLEGHVDVGAGAKVLGGITLREHCVVGANSVVLQDVPAGATAVGMPARIIPNDHSM